MIMIIITTLRVSISLSLYIYIYIYVYIYIYIERERERCIQTYLHAALECMFPRRARHPFGQIPTRPVPSTPVKILMWED